LPNGAAEIPEAGLIGGFCISALLPDNAVERRDGLLFILGGGWSKYNVPQLPCDAIWQVICIANRGVFNLSTARWFQLCLLDPQRLEVSRIAFELPLQVLNGTKSHSLLSIGAPLNSEGLWTLHVQSGGFLLSEIAVSVELVR
jgi:hypothetical protein